GPRDAFRRGQRFPMKSKWSVAIAMLVVAACSTEMDATSRGGGSGGGGGSPATGSDEVNGGGDEARVTGLPCDVDAVLKANCQKCHAAQPQYGASTSLVTYDDLTKDHNGQKVYDLVKSRIHDDARPMPPSPNPRLSDKDMGAIDAWIAGGAKSSSDACSN